jgi:KUP system potassium uptake protein
MGHFGKKPIRIAWFTVALPGVLPDDVFLADIAVVQPHRVKGTAVFMSSTPGGIPNVLVHHMKHNQVLHQQVVLFSVDTRAVPRVELERELEVRELGQGFYRVVAHVGFMQTPDVLEIIGMCAARGLVTQPMTTTYYLGRQTLRSGHATHELRVLVAALRRKIEVDPGRPRWLVAELGVGYRMRSGDDE